MKKIEKDLRRAVKRAVAKFTQNEVRTLTAKKPVKIGVTFLASHLADTAELLPTVNRIDGLNVEYTANNMIEAYKIFELLVLAASGVSALLEKRR